MSDSHKKNRNLEDEIDTTTIALFKSCPDNEQVRAVILSQVLIPVPPDVKTIDQLREWVEYLPEKKNPLDEPIEFITRPHRPAVAPRAGDLTAIAVDLDVRETEIGTCSYSVPTSGTCTFTMSNDELQDLVSTAITDGQSLNSLIASIRDEIDEYVGNNTPDMGSCDSYEYSHYDVSDTQDRIIEYSRSNLTQTVLDWIESNMPDAIGELEQ